MQDNRLLPILSAGFFGLLTSDLASFLLLPDKKFNSVGIYLVLVCLCIMTLINAHLSKFKEISYAVTAFTAILSFNFTLSGEDQLSDDRAESTAVRVNISQLNFQIGVLENRVAALESQSKNTSQR